MHSLSSFSETRFSDRLTSFHLKICCHHIQTHPVLFLRLLVLSSGFFDKLFRSLRLSSCWGRCFTFHSLFPRAKFAKPEISPLSLTLSGSSHDFLFTTNIIQPLQARIEMAAEYDKNAAQMAMLDALSKQQQEGLFADLIVKCGGKEHNLHKAVICATSDFFKTACTGRFMVSTTST